MTTPALQLWVHGLAVLGPGLANWPQARAVLRGEEAYAPAATVLPAPEMLPPAERRRSSRVIKLVMALGAEACAQAGLAPSALASVFTSSTGDGHNCHAICEVLASDQRDVSPTRFHNSVHNTAAGYWCIAAQATGPCQVLAAYDASFAAGLLEAAVQGVCEARDMLLVAYDADYPEPLRATRPVPDAAGLAMVLRPQQQAGALARLDIRWLGGQSVSAAATDAESGQEMAPPALEQLRASIPAMRALPLLQQLASGQAGRVIVPSLPGQYLQVDVTPC